MRLFASLVLKVLDRKPRPSKVVDYSYKECNGHALSPVQQATSLQQTKKLIFDALIDPEDLDWYFRSATGSSMNPMSPMLYPKHSWDIIKFYDGRLWCELRKTK